MISASAIIRPVMVIFRRSKTFLKLLVAILGVSLSGCGSPQTVSSVYGREVGGIFKNPAAVELYRLVRQSDEEIKDPETRADGKKYLAWGTKVIHGPVTPTDDWVQEFKEAILELESMRYSNPKGCDPSPGIAVRLVGETRSVDLLLCFECDMLAFAWVGEDSVIRWQDFDPVRRRLVNLIKEIFPEDREIQQLEPVAALTHGREEGQEAHSLECSNYKRHTSGAC